jgi:hypothetical protein
MYIMRMRTANTFALEALKRSITSVVFWAEDPNGKAYKLHLGRIPDNYWVAEDIWLKNTGYIYDHPLPFSVASLLWNENKP